MMFEGIDTDRMCEIPDAQKRISLFREQCRECKYHGYCQVTMNCFTCPLCKQSKPGSHMGLCACMNVPTVKEKEAGKCKYFEPKEQTDERQTI